MEQKPRKLYRSKSRVIAGVCSGIAEYLNIDPVIVRIIWALITLGTFGFGILAYLICWMVIPEKSV